MVSASDFNCLLSSAVKVFCSWLRNVPTTLKKELASKA